MAACLSFHKHHVLRHFLHGHAQKYKFGGFGVFNFFSSFLFLCYPYPFAAAVIIDVLLGLLPIKKILRNHQDRQFLP